MIQLAKGRPLRNLPMASRTGEAGAILVRPLAFARTTMTTLLANVIVKSLPETTVRMLGVSREGHRAALGTDMGQPIASM